MIADRTELRRAANPAEVPQAEGEARSYLEAMPGDVGAQLILGNIIHQQGRLEEAADHFRQVAAENPDSTDAQAYLARTYQTSGETERAIETAEDLINLQGLRGSSDDLSAITGSLDLYERAISEYEQDYRDRWQASLASLKAAARPAEVPYIYFVSRNDGSHVFSSTLAEHNRNVAKWQQQYWRDRWARERRQKAAPASGQ